MTMKITEIEAAYQRTKQRWHEEWDRIRDAIVERLDIPERPEGSRRPLSVDWVDTACQAPLDLAAEALDAARDHRMMDAQHYASRALAYERKLRRDGQVVAGDTGDAWQPFCQAVGVTETEVQPSCMASLMVAPPL